jgi:hypothetical protein
MKHGFLSAFVFLLSVLLIYNAAPCRGSVAIDQFSLIMPSADEIKIPRILPASFSNFILSTATNSSGVIVTTLLHGHTRGDANGPGHAYCISEYQIPASKNNNCDIAPIETLFLHLPSDTRPVSAANSITRFNNDWYFLDKATGLIKRISNNSIYSIGNMEDIVQVPISQPESVYMIRNSGSILMVFRNISAGNFDILSSLNSQDDIEAIKLGYPLLSHAEMASYRKAPAISISSGDEKTVVDVALLPGSDIEPLILQTYSLTDGEWISSKVIKIKLSNLKFSWPIEDELTYLRKGWIIPDKATQIVRNTIMAKRVGNVILLGGPWRLVKVEPTKQVMTIIPLRSMLLDKYENWISDPEPFCYGISDENLYVVTTVNHDSDAQQVICTRININDL